MASQLKFELMFSFFMNISALYRLDRLTSGVMIFAKQHSSTEKIMKEIAARTVQKKYLCRVVGKFPE